MALEVPRPKSKDLALLLENPYLAGRGAALKVERVQDLKVLAQPDPLHAPIREPLYGAVDSSPAAPPELSPGRGGVTFVDVVSQEAIDLSLDEAVFRQIGEELRALGMDRPSTEVTGALPDVPKNLSGGVDNRLRQGIQDLVGQHSWPESTLAYVGAYGRGSGTLIGNRLVLTAAHVMMDPSGATTWGTVVPRLDTLDTSTGTQIEPYGSVTMTSGTFPTAFWSKGCYTANAPGDCLLYDWYVMILPADPWGSPSPGYMGYAWGTDADFNSWPSYGGGYPACYGSGPIPPDCAAGDGDYTLHRDKQGSNFKTCTTFSFAQPSSTWPYAGENGQVDHRCDTSPGNSGGGVWAYDYTVVATTVQHTFLTPTYGGRGPRVTADAASYFSYLRSTYP